MCSTTKQDFLNDSNIKEELLNDNRTIYITSDFFNQQQFDEVKQEPSFNNIPDINHNPRIKAEMKIEELNIKIEPEYVEDQLDPTSSCDSNCQDESMTNSTQQVQLSCSARGNIGPTMKRKRRMLTLKQKIEIIDTYSQEKLSIRKIAERFAIGKTQAADIVKKQTELLTKWQNNTNENQKKIFNRPEGLIIDALCYKWFLKARSNSIPISGPSIQTKAKQIAANIGHHKFGASHGWLHKFCIRHNIKFKSRSVDHNNVNTITEGLPSLIQSYNAEVKSTARDFNVLNQIFHEDVDNEALAKISSEVPCKIKSTVDALNVIADLKLFAIRSNDFKALELTKNLEAHFQNIKNTQKA